MNVQTIIRHARLYVRAETLVAEIRLRVHLRKMALAMTALAVALLGLVMLNVAMFEFLQSLWGPIWTPLALGLANFAIAAIAIAVAAATKPGPELALAEELRKTSTAGLEAGFQSAGGDAGLLGILTGRSIETHAASLLIPAISSIIAAMRRRKKNAAG
jgi:hypothetical protein